MRTHISEFGIVSTENFRGVLLLVIAGYCVYKGYSPRDIKNVGEAILAKWDTYFDTIVTVTTVLAALADNIHYTYRRTSLKQSGEQK